MDPREVIRQVARQAGIDPAYLLAIAERESSFRPNAHNSQTIHGMYQMTGPLRQKYGIGDSEDPATQTRGFMAYSDDLRKQMATTIGRPPTDPELYLGHHFGPWRAARMVTGQISADMPVNMVFSPREMRENPHFARAGTVGNLTSSITADMNKRLGRHGAEEAANFSEFGEGHDTPAGDFSDFGSKAAPAAEKTSILPEKPSWAPQSGDWMSSYTGKATPAPITAPVAAPPTPEVGVKPSASGAAPQGFASFDQLWDREDRMRGDPIGKRSPPRPPTDVSKEYPFLPESENVDDRRGNRIESLVAQVTGMTPSQWGQAVRHPLTPMPGMQGTWPPEGEMPSFTDDPLAAAAGYNDIVRQGGKSDYGVFR